MDLLRVWKVAYFYVDITIILPIVCVFSTVGFNISDGSQNQFPYYGVPSVIAVNMILAGASGGIVAIIIATWAQVSGRATGLVILC